MSFDSCHNLCSPSSLSSTLALDWSEVFGDAIAVQCLLCMCLCLSSTYVYCIVRSEANKIEIFAIVSYEYFAYILNLHLNGFASPMTEYFGIKRRHFCGFDFNIFTKCTNFPLIIMSHTHSRWVVCVSCVICIVYIQYIQYMVRVAIQILHIYVYYRNSICVCSCVSMCERDK